MSLLKAPVASENAGVDTVRETRGIEGESECASLDARGDASWSSSGQDVAVKADAMLAVSNISKAFGSVSVLEDVSFSVPKAATLAVLGPSGCGKTTLLRIITGLDLPDSGEVWRGDTLLTGAGVNVDVRHRRIGMVFQDLALFPHMSVYKNVAYGLGSRIYKNATSKKVTKEAVEEAIALVGLENLEHRRPHQLSGGQQQRVALARALVPQPEVLLFDEPFASLDTALRLEVRSEVHQLLHSLGTTAIFVTHDQEEAFVIGEEVVVMSDRRIIQHDPPAVLYQQPVSPWVGQFVGQANMLVGDVQQKTSADLDAAQGAGLGPTVATSVGNIELASNGITSNSTASNGITSNSITSNGITSNSQGTQGKIDTKVQVLVRPEHLQLVASSDVAHDTGSTGKVDLVEYHGHDTMYAVQLTCGEVLKVLMPGSSPQFDHGESVNLRYIGPPALAFPVTQSVR